jgi:hypothetical protein
MCALLSMFLLMSCSEEAQDVKDVDCNQVTGLFAIADWQSLAAGPFVEKAHDQSEIKREAPAKMLITAFDDCRVTQIQYAKIKFANEAFFYTCKALASTAKSDDLLGAAKAVAAKWQPCLAGWSEHSEFRKLPIGDMASVRFISDEYKDYSVSFGRSCVGLCNKAPLIVLLLMGFQREPVELTITKFIRK